MIPFRKMHGLGNDFVVIDGRESVPNLTTAQIQLVADRHFGVGCDQLIIIEPPTNATADVFMRIYNPDGSEAEACGNATRCVASLLMNEQSLEKFIIQTLNGNLPATLQDDGNVTIDMGLAQLGWQDVPLSHELDTLHLPIAEGQLKDPVAVGMGNPHCVFIVDDADAIDLPAVGPLVENHKLFPNRTNVEIVSLKTDGALRLRVWERGAGITLACGSGACAAMVAAHLRGLVDRTADIELNGGVLHMEWLENGHVLMAGPVATSFIGELDL